MRTILQSLATLGFVAAMAVSTPTATKAQGVSIYGPGYGVDISTQRYPYRSDRERYYREYYNSYGYYPNYYRSPYRSACPPNHVRRNGICVSIRVN